MWVANAAAHSIELWDWDFFLHKPSLADAAMHQCLTLSDPSYYRYDRAVAKVHETVFAQAYADLDKTIGRLMEIVAQRTDTVLIVASDHGGGVNNAVCDIDQRLRETRLEGRAYTKRNRDSVADYND